MLFINKLHFQDATPVVKDLWRMPAGGIKIKSGLAGKQLRERLIQAGTRKRLLCPAEYKELLDWVNLKLETEDEAVRPRDNRGLPGGLVQLFTNLPTVLIPDLHGRRELLLSVLFSDKIRALDRLNGGQVQVICLGDAFHGEIRVLNRWLEAYSEFQSGFDSHSSMDEEMVENLSTVEIVMLLKSAFPDNFHFLKGNHENITNELGEGNFPFMKFVDEGAMVAEYVNRFLGPNFVRDHRRYEKNLPLLAVGRNFLVSHAEPARFFSRNDVTQFRIRPDVVAGLTWTDNDAAERGSVRKMIEHFLGKAGKGMFYFGGHRPVPGLFNRRAAGRYIQIHNPRQYQIALLPAEGNIKLPRDIQKVPAGGEKEKPL